MIDIQHFWTWIPCISIGPFNFGTPIALYTDKYKLMEHDTYSKLAFGKKGLPKWMHLKNGYENAYILPKFGFAFTIYTKHEIIDDIRIETYLYYNNHDIICNSIHNVMKIIGRESWDDEDSQEIDDCIQQIYYFYDLGLTLWTLDNKVVTAFCNNGVIPNDDDI
jgi:hypothetical protein